MFNVYVALIQKANKPDADYGVYFPDFPGCVFGGNSYEKALLSAQEGIVFHIEGMIDSGESIPLPTALEDIITSYSSMDVIPTLIRVLLPVGKPKRLNISLDTSLTIEIDSFAKAHGYNRSEFLAAAARRMLA